MRTLFVIGIGAGDPEHLTVQAISAMNRVDVFLVIEKGEAKADLVELREEVLRRYVERPGYRVVHGRDPERDRHATPQGYGVAVRDWRRRRADVCERLLLEELEDGQVGAFLVWGDPSLYDSTIGIVEDVVARGSVDLDWHVLPGISSPSALAARHRIVLNQVGGGVQVTTGRRLGAGVPDDVDDIVVMLDPRGQFEALRGEGLDIYWGAYVGTPDELLVAGAVDEVADEILRLRREARERKGWIMDSYLLRRPSTTSGGDAP